MKSHLFFIFSLLLFSKVSLAEQLEFVEQVERVVLKEVEPVYNLSVEGNENYYVGVAKVLVHNCSRADDKVDVFFGSDFPEYDPNYIPNADEVLNRNPAVKFVTTDPNEARGYAETLGGAGDPVYLHRAQVSPDQVNLPTDDLGWGSRGTLADPPLDDQARQTGLTVNRSDLVDSPPTQIESKQSGWMHSWEQSSGSCD